MFCARFDLSNSVFAPDAKKQESRTGLKRRPEYSCYRGTSAYPAVAGDWEGSSEPELEERNVAAIS